MPPTLLVSPFTRKGLWLSQLGTSLQPSSPSPSPSCKLSSAKPLPIHSWPLSPLLGKGGPKAAGRAGKEVLLSSVRVITAFGGNRERGDEKEKKDEYRRFGASAAGAVGGMEGGFVVDRVTRARTERQK